MPEIDDKGMDRSLLFYYLKRWIETNTEEVEQPCDVGLWFAFYGRNELEQLISKALNEVEIEK